MHQHQAPGEEAESRVGRQESFQKEINKDAPHPPQERVHAVIGNETPLDSECGPDQIGKMEKEIQVNARMPSIQ